MANKSQKEIKDIVKGDMVIVDKKSGKTMKVVKNIQTGDEGINIKCVILKKGLVHNVRNIISTKNHPFWINKGKNRIFAEDIKGAQPFDLFEPVYSLQFEEEGTYYIEGGAKVDSISPNHMYHQLRKEEFYDKSKYKAFLMDGEDDPRRNKPKMIYPMPKCMNPLFLLIVNPKF